MKTTSRMALLLLSGLTVSSQANAYDGQITFTGKITDVTCEIVGGVEGGTESKTGSFTVDLPEVDTKDLSRSGVTAGDTQFYLKLSGAQCADGKTANVVFDAAQSGVNNNTGNMNNTISEADGGAVNVQIRLLDGKKNVLDMATGGVQSIAIANNMARFDYWAQYYATSQAIAGTVRSVATYTITYN